MERSAVVATVPREGAADVTVVALHLAHRNTTAGIEARAAQLDALAPYMQGPGTVMLGDFNADNQTQGEGLPKLLESPGHANTLQPLLDAGMTTPQPTVTCTMPTSNENCSDYVFVSADLAVQTVEVLPEQGVGDHRPVVATVE